MDVKYNKIGLIIKNFFQEAYIYTVPSNPRSHFSITHVSALLWEYTKW